MTKQKTPYQRIIETITTLLLFIGYSTVLLLLGIQLSWGFVLCLCFLAFVLMFVGVVVDMRNDRAIRN